MKKNRTVSVDKSQEWLGWFIEQAQLSDAERDGSAPVTLTLQHFAKTLAPDLVLDWGADVGGPPPTGPLVMGRMGSTQPRSPIPLGCFHCGSKVTWRNSQGQGVCGAHEAEERVKEVESQEGAAFAAEMLAARAASPAPTVVAEDQPSPTDCAALFREILSGLNSYLDGSEWTFPPLKITPTVTRGAKQSKPERYMMASLGDVILMGLSDLLLKHGHKIRPCEERHCTRSFLSTGRQAYCSTRCAGRERFARFRESVDKRGGGGFKARRQKYYEAILRRIARKKKHPRQKTKNKGVKP